MKVKKWQHLFEIKATEFPLVETIFKDCKVIHLRSILEQQLDPSTIEHLESFFAEKTLKESLKKQYNCHSPQLIEAVRELLFCEKNHQFRLDMFLALDVMSDIFLQCAESALPEFLQAVKTANIRTVLIFMYPRKPQIKQLMDTFPAAQRLAILLNSSGYKQTADMLEMYTRNPAYFNEVLENTSLNDKNSFRKLHDLFARHNRKLAQDNFELKQEAHFPSIKKIEEADLEGEFKLVAPECYYTLVDWGAKLGHCIGGVGYAQRAKSGQCLLLGLADPKTDEIKYTMEIVGKRINQLQGYSGSAPKQAQREVLVRELKKLSLHA